MLLNVVVDCFFIAHKPGREHKGTNVSLILKDGEYMLPHDWLHHSTTYFSSILHYPYRELLSLSTQELKSDGFILIYMQLGNTR